MAIPPNKFKCLKFTADWTTYLISGTGGDLTWTPTMSGGKLVGGVIHGDMPRSEWCDPENLDDSFGIYGILGIHLISCKRLKIEVTGNGNGWIQSPIIIARRVGETLLHVASEGGTGPACPVTTSAFIPTPYYDLPNPAYIEPDCSHSYTTIEITAYNNYSDAHEFDVTLTLE